MTLTADQISELRELIKYREFGSAGRAPLDSTAADKLADIFAGSVSADELKNAPLIALLRVSAALADSAGSGGIPSGEVLLQLSPGVPTFEGFDFSSIDSVFLSGLAGAVTFPSLVLLNVRANDFQFSDAVNITSLSFPRLTAAQDGMDATFSGLSSITSISLPELVSVDGVFNIESADVLTSLILDSLESVTSSFSLQNNPMLEEVSLPALRIWFTGGAALDSTIKRLLLPALLDTGGDDLWNTLDSINDLTTVDVRSLVDGGGMYLENKTALTSVNFNSLETSNGVSFQASSALPSLSLPKLISSTDQILLNNMDAVVAISMPALTTLTGVNGLDISGNGLLTSVDLSSLQTVGGFIQITDNALLESLTFPALIAADGGVTLDNNAALTTVAFPQLVFVDGQGYSFVGSALSVASVNHVLARAVASGVTSTNIQLQGGTNAAPTGQGIADKAALILAGNTVTTN